MKACLTIAGITAACIALLLSLALMLTERGAWWWGGISLLIAFGMVGGAAWFDRNTPDILPAAPDPVDVHAATAINGPTKAPPMPTTRRPVLRLDERRQIVNADGRLWLVTDPPLPRQRTRGLHWEGR